MLKDIIKTHREMMYEFMEVAGVDDYGLAWICFLKGVAKSLDESVKADLAIHPPHMKWSPYP